ncbi:MAG TPA: methylated-DNA--[protein]-cysteine S-methyltransferase [Saprospiraceae bacterium]|nr:methylated-DNA--[protein]-cysteine S-methyltransferase [Saprospiraceae bacterium]
MLQTAKVNSPFGCFELKGSELGLQSVKRISEEPCLDAPLSPAELLEAAEQLSDYFAGRRQKFDLQIDWGQATDFNKQVWLELLRIPYGHTTTYSAIAKKINHPTAVRAVGLANKNNPIAIIIPCHRVIAKSGHLQGYFYGLDMKRALLELENPGSFSRQGSLF